MIFVDTSALLALLSAEDSKHAAAVRCWKTLIESGETLLTNNYVLVESTAVIQNRLGLEAVRDLQTGLLGILQTDWVSPEDHRSAIESLLAAGRRSLSLVDCCAFQTMRARGIRTAFTFDKDFEAQGFSLLP